MNSDTVTLPESLKIDTVQAVHARLDEVLSKPTAIAIDAASCEAIDYSGVQLLLTFAKAVAEGGRVLEWTGVTETLINAARDIGANDLFSTS